MKKLFKSKLFLQVIVASMVATLATVGIVGAVTTIGDNINTAGTLTVTGVSTLTDDLAVDGNTLLVDASADRVGIGSTTPFATLSIDTNAGENAFVIGSTTATWLKVDASGLLTVAKGATFSSTLAVTGNFNVNGMATTTAAGVLTTSGSIGIASTTPSRNLSIGSSSTASSTIAMGKFCLQGSTPGGTVWYLTLCDPAASTCVGNQVFATSTTPCY